MKRILLTIVVFATLGATPAAASRWLLMGGIGASAPTGDLSALVNADLALHAALAGPIFGPLHWRGEVGFDSFSISNDVRDFCDGINADCDLGAKRLGIGLQLNLRLVGFEPYGYFTLGGYRHKVDAFSRVPLPIGSGSVTESKTDLGVAFGGGVIFHLGLHVGLAGELRLNKINAESSLWYVTPSANLVLSW